MPFKLSYLDSDFRSFVVTAHNSMRRPGMAHEIVYPQSLSEEGEDFLEQRTKKFAEKKGYHVLKITDEETGDLVAGARWIIHGHERTQQEVDEEIELKPLPMAEVNNEALAAFLTPINKERAQRMGTKPYIHLDSLWTSAKYERRGAASMLMKWGVEQSEERGLLCYIEASHMGAPLYEKFGFVTVKEITLDKALYGGHGIDVHRIMIREPKPKGNSS